MLKLDDVCLYYGRVHALRGISLEVPEGRIVSLLGANGAGKSSTLKVISGLCAPQSGDVRLNGESVQGRSCGDLVKNGVIHCPEGRRVFPQFTVEENLRVGAYRRIGNKDVDEDMETVFGYFPRLKERMQQKAATLSGGEQQMLAIGRSLMGRPRLLLLDEPSLGIAPKLVMEIFEILKRINKAGTAILLVEQNAHMAIKISDYSYVLENGRIGLEGDSAEISQRPELKELYLGG
ncbi:ABC transporter ATP-binding protein [Alloalcanivorax xenomutans]|uniref:ABC transporter ATP-binding protein n=1 Tax=Alloalcanivorax xenomutans TaxID=1094342 RepID=UPI0007A73B18|nr:ABC transporter ATP-binding protein [Alloalcanivorax xenomutans]KYZ87751.1 ABC transporter ATP-binding protein [Alcanivorax sp. KX64203]MCE7524490.1 ABC transporter ATP-binding protein [Alloalcanivorax xenomutans]WOA30976.1 ABC transporter ATP-binding protein [Alloalcanivorax xenomutans]WOD27962.1 ABC transporter ATP-binding protein [Alloalcanivorax xenomutans]